MRYTSLSKTIGFGHVLSMPAPAYSFITAPTSVNEGGTITFVISATGLPIGTQLGWDIALSGGLTLLDFVAYTGTADIISNVSSVSIQVTADFLTEGAETFQLRVYSETARTNLVLTSATVTINDTSVPTYTFTTQPLTLNEGVAGNFSITTQGTADGTFLYWTINHTTTSAADFSAVSGAFMISSNSGTFSITTIADLALEGSEAFTVSIRTGSISGTIVATSTSIGINDTSIPAFTAFTATPNTPAYLTQAITVNYSLGSETSAVMNIGTALVNANVTSPMQVVPYIARQMSRARYAVDRFLTLTTEATGYVTSTDGITWTTGTGSMSNMASITKSATIWVAVGVQGACFRSTDGINWTSQTTNAYPYDLYVVTWTGSAFVAAGNGAVIVSSVDGITWTLRQSGAGTNNITELEFGGTVLIASGFPNAGGAFIQTSTAAGASWTLRNITATGSATQSAWTGSIWLTLAGGSVYSGGAAGATWAQVATPTSGQTTTTGIAYGAGVLVVASSRGELYLTTTPAAPVWIKVFETGNEGGNLSFGAGVFVYTSVGTCTSTDGYTWVRRSAAMNTWTISPVGTGFYAGAGGLVYKSTNGLDWDNGTKLSPWNYYSYSANIGNNIIVCGTHGRDTAYGSQWVGISMSISTDNGVTWYEKFPNQAYGPAYNIQLSLGGITTSASRFVLWGQNSIWTSSGTDGSSWFQATTFTGNVRSCVWTGSKFMAKGDTTDGWTSTDGVAWTTVTTTSVNITAGVWTGTTWFASAWLGRIVYSTDGATWTTIQTPSANDLNSIAYISSINTLVAVGAAGTIVSSTNGGSTWVVRSSPTSQYILRVTANGSRFCATTNELDGTVITSTDGINWKISRFALNMVKYNTTSAFNISMTGSPGGAVVSQSVSVQGMPAPGLSSSYTIVPTVATMNEGTTNTWAVTQTNLTMGGALYWTNSGTSVAADFTDGLNQGSIIMSYRLGLQIERSTTNDATSEGSETVVLQLRTGSPSGTVVATATSVTINDTSLGTGTAVPNYTYIHQGETVIYTINTSGIPTGTTLYWTTTAPSGVIFTDADTFTTGSYTVTAGTPYTLTRYTRMNNVGGYCVAQAMYMNFYFDAAHTSLAFQSSVCNVMTNNITLDVTSTIDETSSTTTTFTFRIFASGGPAASDVRGTAYWIPNYMTFWWEILGNNYASPISAADFSTALTGSFVANGALVSSLYRQATWTKVAVADLLTEGTESYNGIIRSESATGPLIATSNTGVISDTSLTPGAAFNSTPGSFQEGTAGTFSVLAINYTGTYYWTINHITTVAADFVAVSGSFPVSAGSGTFSITPTADATTEGSETFTVSIRFGSTSGTVMATSATQTIADTSYTPSYAFASPATSINEGVTTNYSVTTSGVASGTTLYWTIAHGTTVAADFSAVSGSFTVTGTYASSSGIAAVVTTADLTTEGSQTFTLQIRTGSTAGTVVLTSATITIADTSTTPPGQVVHATTGSTTWVCPAGVTSVSIVCIGAGGGGAGFNGSTNNFGAGGGGSVVYRNNVAVTPGTTYYLYVPQVAAGVSGGTPYYGAGNVSNAGDGSFAMFGTGFTSATALCYAPGGHGGRTFNIDSTPYTGAYQGGLGGGATGLSDFSLGTLGVGGQGGNGNSTGFGAGGGGAGGYGAAGGQGQGSNGAAGTRGGAYTTTSGTAGAIGTGQSLLGTTPGGGNLYGGGGGGGWVATGTRGANGAVRIMWPGDVRQYPATGVADQ